MNALVTRIKAVIPRPMRRRIQAAPYMFSVIRRMGGGPTRECPCCSYKGRFAAFGHPPRYDAECRGCGAMERHRLLQLVFNRTGILAAGANVLHFAPEPMVSKMMPKDVQYVTADIRKGRADLVLNLEAIDLPEGSQDVIIANHVLEHVDDKRALAELYRVLRPTGKLIITVPIVEGWDHTYENPNVVDDAGRRLHFGQEDHVRLYGRDLRDRIKAAGFELTEFVGTGEETIRYRLLPGERVFMATHPQ